MAGLQKTWLAAALIGCVWIGGVPRAQAQAAESQAIPRTLHDGAPARRFAPQPRQRPDAAQGKPAAPAPSIVLDPRDLLPRKSMERRSAALLAREIAVLKRLLRNLDNRDQRHADALLRLSYALQELMFQQKQRIYELQEAGYAQCRCSAPSDASPTALACATPTR